MIKNIIIIFAHFALATSLTVIVLFSNKISTLLFILIGIFGLISFYLKCNDCPAFQIESSYDKRPSSDIVGSFLLGEKYYNVDRQMFTMIILYISFMLTVIKIVGIVVIKYIRS